MFFSSGVDSQDQIKLEAVFMPGVGRKGNLGLRADDERLTVGRDGLVECQAPGASRTRLSMMEVGGCGRVLC